MPFAPDIQLHQLGFAPDLPLNTPGIILDSDAVYPTVSGIRLLPGFQTLAALPANNVPTGALRATLANGTVVVVAGSSQTGEQLWLWQNAYSWILNQIGGLTPNSNNWHFAVFGTDILGTNGVDPIQVSSNGGVFGVLGGNPPIGKLIACVDPGGTAAQAFVFNTASDPTFWACSKQGADNVWSLNVADLSASGRLQTTPGAITAAIALGTSMVVFKSNSIYIGQFIGPPFVWSFQLQDAQYGVQNQEAAVSLGDVIFFVMPKGPCFFTFDGSSVRGVTNACWQWFLANVNMQYFANIRLRYDSTAGVVYIYFPNKANLGTVYPVGSLDTWLAWNITNNRWTVGHNFIVSCALDTNDASGTPIYQPLNQILVQPALFGGPITPPGNLSVPFVYNALVAYSGTPTPGYITTGYYGQEERLTAVRRARALWHVSPAGHGPGGRSPVVLTPMTADVLGAASIAGPPVAISPRSWFDFRQAARYHQFKFVLNVDAEITGFHFDNADAGTR